ncbi:hypothetical protein ABZT06_46270 [Streptomyces sp. NPDC005483]
MSHLRISDALRALVFEPDPTLELDQVLDGFLRPGLHPPQRRRAALPSA